MTTDTIERVDTDTVKFFNEKNKNVTYLVQRDPNFDPSPLKNMNPTTANDKKIQFRNGMAESADPDIIAWCNSPQAFAKGVRCFDNPDHVAEANGVDPKWLQETIERRAAELVTEQKHEERTNRKAPAGSDLNTQSPE